MILEINFSVKVNGVNVSSIIADYAAGTFGGFKSSRIYNKIKSFFFHLVGALLIGLQFVGGIASLCGAGYLMGRIMPYSNNFGIWCFRTLLSSIFIMGVSLSVTYILIKLTQKINKLSGYRFLPRLY